MNAETQITDDPILLPAPESTRLFDYRGNGKVARLPKNLRDQVNYWLLDGRSYPEIIEYAC